MSSSGLLRQQIEARIPSAFRLQARPQCRYIPIGMHSLDGIAGGVPIGALTEICGSSLASSGKTSALISLLAHASQEHFCALVDVSDCFDPVSAQAAGMNSSRLLWVRCGKSKQKLRPLEQAFKVADMLLQSSGFGLIAVDLSDIPERFVRNIPLSTWFRFSRVVEGQSTALVFIERQPHATSCAELVLNIKTSPALFSGNLLTQLNFSVEVMRTRNKKPVQAIRPAFPVRTQWS
jgi:hypothetical protein